MTAPVLTRPPATPPSGPEISRRRLGAILRDLRESRSVLLGDAARLDVAPSTLSPIETGKAPTRTSYLSLLLDLYELSDPDYRRDLADLARQGQRHPWWTGAADILPLNAGCYLGLEYAATSIRVFATQLIPGPLQRPDYTTAAIRATQPGLTTDQTRTLAALNERRRELLDREGFRLHAVLDETVLHRPPGSTTAMTSQLTDLASLTDRENVTVQILSLTTPWPIVSPPFTLLAFPDSDDPGTACTIDHGGQYQLTRNQKHLRGLSRTFTTLSRAALPADISRRLISDLAQHSVL
jgi:hypothetical protein